MPANEPLRTSVIVPCYNTAAYLPEAIESILLQDHAADEILVVDDGSEDATAAVAARFGARIRYHVQPHQGIGAARNAGIRMARGNCIAFLDADDVWPTVSLGCRIDRLASAPELDCVYGQTEQFISPDIDPAVRGGIHCPPGTHAARVAGAMVIRRSVFDRIGLFDTTLAIGETMDWVARFDERGLVAAAIDRVVLRRRIHATNTVIRERHRQGDYLKILKASLDRRRKREGAPGATE